jgi:hypothetical protein
VSVVTTAKPVTMSVAAYSQYVGMKAETAPATANRAVPPTTTRMRARSRRAASRAPVSEPIARIELRRPYPSAFCPNSSAIVDAKIGKFMPKAPRRKTIAKATMRSGRLPT